MAIQIATITVATAGTRVPLASSITQVKWFAVQPLAANTLNVYVGDVTVSHSGPTGIALAPAGSPFIFHPCGNAAPYDLSLIYADADTSGNKLSVVWLD